MTQLTYLNKCDLEYFCLPCYVGYFYNYIISSITVAIKNKTDHDKFNKWSLIIPELKK